MNFFSQIFRLIRINFILARYNIDEIILGTHWFYPFRFIVYLNPYYWTAVRKLPRGVRIRLALEELGPIFVKAGQVASTRRDLIPDDIASELSKLQDRVPAFSSKKAIATIEAALQCPISEKFSEFNPEPLASASIAQVHAAKLMNGQSVVIKVLRPNIRKMIERDINLLMTIVRIVSRYSSHIRRFKPKEMVNEIAQTLFDEIDLMREAANASQLARNFVKSDLVHVPKIYWDFCHQDICVMERIYGIPIHDVDSLKHAGVNMTKLAENMVEVFFTQVFRDSYFHADLHPGNIFVNTDNPKNPSLTFVDFGIVGSLSHDDKRYIAENMIAFFKRDYQRVAELHVSCGWLPPDTRIDQFESAIRSVSEPIFEQPLRDISFGNLLLRLFQVARRFNLNIQPQLILLQKTLVNIEGLSRSLAPELDLWATAAPQIEKWLRKQVGFRAYLKRIRENLPLWSEQLPEIPSMIYEVLKESKRQQEKARFNAMINRKNSGPTSHRQRLLYYFLGVGTSALVIAGLYFANLGV